MRGRVFRRRIVRTYVYTASYRGYTTLYSISVLSGWKHRAEPTDRECGTIPGCLCAIDADWWPAISLMELGWTPISNGKEKREKRREMKSFETEKKGMRDMMMMMLDKKSRHEWRKEGTNQLFLFIRSLVALFFAAKMTVSFMSEPLLTLLLRSSSSSSWHEEGIDRPTALTKKKEVKLKKFLIFLLRGDQLLLFRRVFFASFPDFISCEIDKSTKKRQVFALLCVSRRITRFLRRRNRVNHHHVTLLQPNTN